jgi:hypothetical protein
METKTLFIFAIIHQFYFSYSTTSASQEGFFKQYRGLLALKTNRPFPGQKISALAGKMSLNGKILQKPAVKAHSYCRQQIKSAKRDFDLCEKIFL